jgi:hypothetical protein
MNRSSNHAFVNQVLVYTLVMICFTGSIGLGTVWMRHQISLTANATKVLDARIAELDRRISETTAAMEREQDPGVLKERNEKWNLGLAQPTQEQIVRVSGDPVLRLAAKRDRALYRDSALPATVSLRIAGLTP